MIEIIKELKIEVSKPNIFQAVVAKQYDMNTRFIKATLVDGSDVIYIPSGPTIKAIINANRPDGQSKGFDGVVNDDGTVTVPLHSWMLEMEGTVICDISIIDTEANDNKKLTTTTFTLLVEKAAYGGSDVTNDPQYDVLVSLLETCNEANEVAQEALEKSNEANEKYYACVEATDNANQAAENANAVREEVEAGGFIESLKEMNNGGKFSFWVGTQAEYNALTEKNDGCFYIITDDPASKQVDYIIEQGEVIGYGGKHIVDNEMVDDNTSTKVTWHYTKWASGKVELWTNNIPHTVKWEKVGSVWVSTESDIPLPELPAPETLIKTIEYVNGGVRFWHYANWSSVTQDGYGALSIDIRYYGFNDQEDGQDRLFFAHVIGTWK